MFLTETWLAESDPSTQYNKNGYQTIKRKPGKTEIHGSIAFYDKIEVENIFLEYESEFEFLVGRFTSTNLKGKILCCCWARCGKLQLFR